MENAGETLRYLTIGEILKVAERVETAPTSPDTSRSKPRGEGAYLFLEFTIN